MKKIISPRERIGRLQEREAGGEEEKDDKEQAAGAPAPIHSDSPLAQPVCVSTRDVLSNHETAQSGLFLLHMSTQKGHDESTYITLHYITQL